MRCLFVFALVLCFASAQTERYQCQYDKTFIINSTTTQLPCLIWGNLEFAPGITSLHPSLNLDALEQVTGAVCVTNTKLISFPVFKKLQKIGVGICTTTSGASFPGASFVIAENTEVVNMQNMMPYLAGVPGDIVLKSNPKLANGAIGEVGSAKKRYKIYNILRLAILVDIATDQAAELDTVKKLSNGLIATLNGKSDKVEFVIIPFTEYGNGCFASYHTFYNATAASAFISGITLGSSPSDLKAGTISATPVKTTTSLGDVTGTGYTEITFPFPNNDYSTGTLSFPAGFAPSYSTDGGKTYKLVEPLSGVTHIRLEGALSGSPGVLVIIPKPTAGAVASKSSGGDGFEPLIIGTRVFNMFHHLSSTQFVCTNTADGSTCPHYIWSVGRTTSNGPVAYADAINEKIYWPTKDGFGCANVPEGKAPSLCTKTNQGGFNTDGFISSNTAGCHSGWGYPDYARGRLYSRQDCGNKIHCLDVNNPNAPRVCDHFPYNVPFQPSRVQIMPKTTIILASNGGQTMCIDAKSTGNVLCSGWPNNGIQNIGHAYGAPIPIMNANGIAEGFCMSHANRNDCYKLSNGKAINNADANMIAGRNALNQCMAAANTKHVMNSAYSHQTFYQAKTIIQYGQFNELNIWCCYDGKTQQPCRNFPGSKIQQSGTYGISIDPANSGSCAWSLGDKGVLNSWSTINPKDQCSASNPIFYVTPSESYCGGSSITSWESAELKHATKGVDYSAAILNVFDMTGNKILSQDLSSGKVNLPFAVSGNSVTLKFEIVFTLLVKADDLFVKSASRPFTPQLDVRWKGTAMQVCVTAKSTVTPQVCTYDGHAGNAVELLGSLSVIPTLAFVISNAKPITTTNSVVRSEAVALLDKVKKKFQVTNNSNILIINPVVQTDQHDTATFGLYAKETAGMLLQPSSTDTTTLAKGYEFIINRTLAIIEGFPEKAASGSPPGFTMYNVSAVTRAAAIAATYKPPKSTNPQKILDDSASGQADVVLTTVAKDSLENIGGSVIVDSNPVLTKLNLDSIKKINHTLQLTNNPSVTWSRFEGLTSVGNISGVKITDNVAPAGTSSCPAGFGYDQSQGAAIGSLLGCVCLPINGVQATTAGGTSCVQCITSCPPLHTMLQPCTYTTQAQCIFATWSPTKSPTNSPTKAPTRSPTNRPTSAPTKRPTKFPTSIPTKLPTAWPTRNPTAQPSRSPTVLPTRSPTAQPTADVTQQISTLATAAGLDPQGGATYEEVVTFFTIYGYSEDEAKALAKSMTSGEPITKLYLKDVEIPHTLDKAQTDIVKKAYQKAVNNSLGVPADKVSTAVETTTVFGKYNLLALVVAKVEDSNSTSVLIKGNFTTDPTIVALTALPATQVVTEISVPPPTPETTFVSINVTFPSSLSQADLSSIQNAFYAAVTSSCEVKNTLTSSSVKVVQTTAGAYTLKLEVELPNSGVPIDPFTVDTIKSSFLQDQLVVNLSSPAQSQTVTNSTAVPFNFEVSSVVPLVSPLSDRNRLALEPVYKSAVAIVANVLESSVVVTTTEISTGKFQFKATIQDTKQIWCDADKVEAIFLANDLIARANYGNPVSGSVVDSFTSANGGSKPVATEAILVTTFPGTLSQADMDKLAAAYVGVVAKATGQNVSSITARVFPTGFPNEYKFQGSVISNTAITVDQSKLQTEFLASPAVTAAKLSSSTTTAVTATPSPQIASTLSSTVKFPAPVTGSQLSSLISTYASSVASSTGVASSAIHVKATEIPAGSNSYTFVATVFAPTPISTPLQTVTESFQKDPNFVTLNNAVVTAGVSTSAAALSSGINLVTSRVATPVSFPDTRSEAQLDVLLAAYERTVRGLTNGVLTNVYAQEMGKGQYIFHAEVSKATAVTTSAATLSNAFVATEEAKYNSGAAGLDNNDINVTGLSQVVEVVSTIEAAVSFPASLNQTALDSVKKSYTDVIAGETGLAVSEIVVTAVEVSPGYYVLAAEITSTDQVVVDSSSLNAKLISSAPVTSLKGTQSDPKTTVSASTPGLQTTVTADLKFASVLSAAQKQAEESSAVTKIAAAVGLPAGSFTTSWVQDAKDPTKYRVEATTTVQTKYSVSVDDAALLTALQAGNSVTSSVSVSVAPLSPREVSTKIKFNSPVNAANRTSLVVTYVATLANQTNVAAGAIQGSIAEKPAGSNIYIVSAAFPFTTASIDTAKVSSSLKENPVVLTANNNKAISDLTTIADPAATVVSTLESTVSFSKNLTATDQDAARAAFSSAVAAATGADPTKFNVTISSVGGKFKFSTTVKNAKTCNKGSLISSFVTAVNAKQLNGATALTVSDVAAVASSEIGEKVEEVTTIVSFVETLKTSEVEEVTVAFVSSLKAEGGSQVSSDDVAATKLTNKVYSLKAKVTTPKQNGFISSTTVANNACTSAVGKRLGCEYRARKKASYSPRVTSAVTTPVKFPVALTASQLSAAKADYAAVVASVSGVATAGAVRAVHIGNGRYYFSVEVVQPFRVDLATSAISSAFVAKSSVTSVSGSAGVSLAPVAAPTVQLSVYSVPLTRFPTQLSTTQLKKLVSAMQVGVAAQTGVSLANVKAYVEKSSNGAYILKASVPGSITTAAATVKNAVLQQQDFQTVVAESAKAYVSDTSTASTGVATTVPLVVTTSQVDLKFPSDISASQLAAVEAAYKQTLVQSSGFVDSQIAVSTTKTATGAYSITATLTGPAVTLDTSTIQTEVTSHQDVVKLAPSLVAVVSTSQAVSSTVESSISASIQMAKALDPAGVASLKSVYKQELVKITGVLDSQVYVAATHLGNGQYAVTATVFHTTPVTVNSQTLAATIAKDPTLVSLNNPPVTVSATQAVQIVQTSVSSVFPIPHLLSPVEKSNLETAYKTAVSQSTLVPVANITVTSSVVPNTVSSYKFTAVLSQEKAVTNVNSTDVNLRFTSNAVVANATVLRATDVEESASSIKPSQVTTTTTTTVFLKTVLTDEQEQALKSAYLANVLANTQPPMTAGTVDAVKGLNGKYTFTAKLTGDVSVAVQSTAVVAAFTQEKELVAANAGQTIETSAVQISTVSSAQMTDVISVVQAQAVTMDETTRISQLENATKTATTNTEIKTMTSSLGYSTTDAMNLEQATGFLQMFGYSEADATTMVKKLLSETGESSVKVAALNLLVLNNVVSLSPTQQEATLKTATTSVSVFGGAITKNLNLLKLDPRGNATLAETTAFMGLYNRPSIGKAVDKLFKPRGYPKSIFVATVVTDIVNWLNSLSAQEQQETIAKGEEQGKAKALAGGLMDTQVIDRTTTTDVLKPVTFAFGAVCLVLLLISRPLDKKRAHALSQPHQRASFLSEFLLTRPCARDPTSLFTSQDTFLVQMMYAVTATLAIGATAYSNLPSLFAAVVFAVVGFIPAKMAEYFLRQSALGKFSVTGESQKPWTDVNPSAEIELRHSRSSRSSSPFHSDPLGLLDPLPPPVPPPLAGPPAGPAPPPTLAKPAPPPPTQAPPAGPPPAGPPRAGPPPAGPPPAGPPRAGPPPAGPPPAGGRRGVLPPNVLPPPQGLPPKSPPAELIPPPASAPTTEESNVLMIKSNDRNALVINTIAPPSGPPPSTAVGASIPAPPRLPMSLAPVADMPPPPPRLAPPTLAKIAPAPFEPDVHSPSAAGSRAGTPSAWASEKDKKRKVQRASKSASTRYGVWLFGLLWAAAAIGFVAAMAPADAASSVFPKLGCILGMYLFVECICAVVRAKIQGQQEDTKQGMMDDWKSSSPNVSLTKPPRPGLSVRLGEQEGF